MTGLGTLLADPVIEQSPPEWEVVGLDQRVPAECLHHEPRVLLRLRFTFRMSTKMVSDAAVIDIYRFEKLFVARQRIRFGEVVSLAPGDTLCLTAALSYP